MTGRFLRITYLVLYAIAVSTLPTQAQEKSDEEILQAIKEHPYRAAACLSPYYAPEVEYTPAPEGYEAFYVSHFGRHGSRFQTDGSSVYDKTVALLDSLHYANALTLRGDSLRMEIRHMQQHHTGMDGMLTRKGSAEHTAIAARLLRRCPSIFNQTNRKTVHCISTQKQRTIQSMAGFIAGLTPAGNGLDFQVECGIDINLIKYKRAEDSVDKSKEISSATKAEEKAMAPKDAELEALQSRLFKGFKASEKELFRIFKASASAGCLDINVNPLRFFTPEELFAFYRKNDVHYNAKYGTFAPVRSETARKGKPFVRMIVNDADMAIDGNGHCADFRFAHDTQLGPIMNLLGIGGYSYTSHEDAPYRYWQSFNQICMASNLQLEFYRNNSNDVLVKALFNEREVNFPGLKAVNNVYYKWSDVRRYLISKCEDIREVPEYYSKYLKGKSAQIKELQKNELCGFFFVTDMHFPNNYGNSAALIEMLEKSTSKRLIVYGGDAISYVDDINEGMAMQISALEQMRGVSPVLWARGNHDIVNYTGKKEWIKGERKALQPWESSKMLSRFRPMDAVSNIADPYTTYCYYDNSETKIRFILFDTSDTVQDDNKQSGLSQTQLRWIIEEAILKAPENYGLVFISHKPFLGEKKMEAAGNALTAFSTHTPFKMENKEYDFAKRTDLRMLCLVCGHKHYDYSLKFPGGQPQINVIADSNYEYLKREKGTIQEQSFDYVSISNDGHIRTVRIGLGENREF